MTESTTPDTPDAPALLSPECAQLIDDIEVYATPLGAGFVELRNCDGHFLFRVTTGIKVCDLSTLINVYHHRFAAGQESGREGAFAGLRSLLGVDDAIAKATGKAS